MTTCCANILLIKKGVEKEKEALEKKKQYIDEELQRRKDASNEAKKAEELAEYQRQLALISMDSTRTKDVKELQKKIDDLQEERGWKIAEEQVEAQKKSMDDEIEAYDQYVTYGDEDLERLLRDANNFAEEVNGVMKLNQTELFDWLKKNVKEYTYSIEDAQTQMVQSWTDTYKQMLHILDTYWDEVHNILGDRESFAAYMMASDEYQTASDDKRKQLLYQWLDVDAGSGSYDAWIAAMQDMATYFHSDENFANYNGGDGSGGGNGGGNTGGNTNSGANKNANSDEKIATIKRYQAGWETAHGFQGRTLQGFRTEKEARAAAEAMLDELAASFVNANPQRYGDVATTVRMVHGYAQALKNKINVSEYKSGGLVDYTGPAWVDGTKSKPEAFLNSDDREMIRGLLDSGVMADMRKMISAFSRVSVPMFSTAFRSDMLTGKPTVTVGDIHVSTNQLNDNLDLQELAEKVGQEFVKQISGQGIATTRLSW